MRNTTEVLTIGKAIGVYINGNITLPTVFDYELSPLQVRSLTSRMLRQARTA
jgi:hypothetical protein